jgi:DNA-binding transcriptional LysR family regulator
MMKTNSEEWLVFVAIVETGSISKAAQALGKNNASISRSLTRLEKKLGIALLHRTTRRIRLSDEGQIFFREAKEIIRMMEMAEEQIGVNIQEAAGYLRVNAEMTFMLHVILPYLSEFRSLYPHILLELNTDDGLIDLMEKGTDVAIRIAHLQDSTLHARHLASSPVRILASPSYLSQYGNPQEVNDLLTQHTLLGFSSMNGLNEWPLRDLENQNIVIIPKMRVSSAEVLRQMALSGLGIVCLADYVTWRDQQNGELIPLLVEHTLTMSKPIHAVFYKHTAPPRRLSCFLDFLIQKLNGL